MENKYFPELDSKNKKLYSKYGILNVGLIKNDKVITGHQWNYQYWTGRELKLIHSYNLIILREKVEKLGEEWIITDNKLAIDSYKLNNYFLKLRKEYIEKFGERGRWNTTGVKYLSKQKSDNYKKGFCWVYRNNGATISSTDLKKLKIKVEDRGYPWIINDEELYANSLNE